MGYEGWTGPNGVFLIDCRFNHNDHKDPAKTQQRMFWGEGLDWCSAGLCERGTSADSVAIIGDSRARSLVAHIQKIPFNQKNRPVELANVLVSSWASACFKQLVLRAEHYLQLGAARNILVFFGGINDAILLFSQRVVPERDEWKEAAASRLRPLKEFLIKHKGSFITPKIVETFDVEKRYNRLTDDFKHSVNEFLKIFNEALQDICNENGGTFVGTSQLNLDLNRDGIHITYKSNFVIDNLVVSAPKRQKSERDSNPQCYLAHHLRNAIQKELRHRGKGYTADIL